MIIDLPPKRKGTTKTTTTISGEYYKFFFVGGDLNEGLGLCALAFCSCLDVSTSMLVNPPFPTGANRRRMEAIRFKAVFSHLLGFP